MVKKTLRTRSSALLIMLAALLPAGIAIAQVPFYNNGSVVKVAAGTTLYVKGDVTNNAGTLTNSQELHVDGNYTNNANYNGTGLIRIAGASGRTFTAGGVDTVDAVMTTCPTLTLNSELQISTSVSLSAVTRVLTADGTGKLVLYDGAYVLGTSATAYVDGPLYCRANAPATLDFQIGNGTSSYFPAAVNVTPSSSFVEIRGETLPATVTGTAGPGIGNLLTGRHWEFAISSGTVSSVNDVRLHHNGLYTSDFSTLRIGQATTLGGVYNNIGSWDANPVVVDADGSTNANAAINPGLGYFTIGKCAYLGGTVALNNSTVCEGADNALASIGYDPEDLQWQISYTGIGGPFVDIPGATSGNVNQVVDTLSKNAWLRMKVSGSGGCADGYSDIASISVTPRLKVNVTAFLEGPYHAAGDSMYWGEDGLVEGLETSFAPLLTERFEYGSPEASPIAGKMYQGFSVPEKAIDVIKLELWDAALTSKADTAYAWLMKDGSIRDFYTGTLTSVPLSADAGCASGPASYRIVVRHRNHLALVSALQTVGASPNPSVINLALAANVTGTVANIDTSPARVGLQLGNALDDALAGDQGELNASDLFLVLERSKIAPGYSYEQSDLDLDGKPSPTDLTGLQVPASLLLHSSAPNE